MLRVERLLARASWNKKESQPTLPTEITFGQNSVDLTTGRAVCYQRKIALTEQEIKLLKLFWANAGQPLSRKKLLEIGWGYTGGISTRTVDNFIVRLRRYFEKNPKKPRHFKSQRSVGYIFEPEPDKKG